MSNLLFDKLLKLREHPEKFEQVSREAIDSYIESFSSEKRKIRARQIQFKIDSSLRNIKNPIARMNKIIELFWESVNELNETLNGKIPDKYKIDETICLNNVIEFKK